MADLLTGLMRFILKLIAISICIPVLVLSLMAVYFTLRAVITMISLI